MSSILENRLILDAYLRIQLDRLRLPYSFKTQFVYLPRQNIWRIFYGKYFVEIETNNINQRLMRIKAWQLARHIKKDIK
jgi:hypothetical protein